MTIGEAPEAIRKAVDESVREVNHKAMSKAFRVSNAMRNSVIEILTNESVAPPNSPPGMLSGFLRRAWKTGVRNKGGAGSGMSIVAFADAKAYYAGYLEDGTKKMEARPFVKPILEDVEPKVDRIFADL
jgi:HK97 gp10 family phage protein